MKKVLLFLLVVCLSQNIFSQKNKKKEQEVEIVIHNVKIGETVRTISKKYLVEPSEIYKYNNFAVNGINEGMVLQIPVPVKEPVLEKVESHEDVAYEEPKPKVVEKPVAEVKKPVVKPVVTPKNPEKQVTTIEKKSEITHTVQPKETLYSLSKMYNISVDEIKASNGKTLENGLQVGQVIKIKASKVLEKYESEPEPKDVAAENAITKTDAVAYSQPVIDVSRDKVAGNIIEHKVGPKETLYSLSKKYTNSIDEINQLNPDLASKGLQIGQVVKLNKK